MRSCTLAIFLRTGTECGGCKRYWTACYRSGIHKSWATEFYMVSPNVLWALCMKLASCPQFKVAPKFFEKSVDPTFRLYRNAILFKEVSNVEAS